jgi:hypothetical protein
LHDLGVFVVRAVERTVVEHLWFSGGRACRGRQWGGVKQIYEIRSVMWKPTRWTFLVKDVSPDAVPASLTLGIFTEAFRGPRNACVVDQIQDVVYDLVVRGIRRDVIGA